MYEKMKQRVSLNDNIIEQKISNFCNSTILPGCNKLLLYPPKRAIEKM